MKKILFIIALLVVITSCERNNEFDATGTFEAVEVTVSAENSGKVLNFNIDEGQKIEKDVPVGCIDTTQLYLQVKQLKSQQNALMTSKPDVQKQLASLREQIRKQEREVKRIENLLDGEAATAKQLDDAQAQLSVYQKQLDATLQQLQSNSSAIDHNASAAEWQIQQLEDRIAKSFISSPVSGTVLVKYIQAGEVAVQGRPLMKVADLDNIYLRAYFTSDQLSKVKLGQKVTVIADFGGSEQIKYDGIVSWISDESEFTPKGIQTKNSRAELVYATKIAVKNDGRLKIGLYGEVRL